MDNATIQEAIAWHKAGETLREISHAYNTNTSTLSKAFRKAGYNPMLSPTILTVIARLDQGENIADLAREYGTTIYARLRQAGYHTYQPQPMPPKQIPSFIQETIDRNRAGESMAALAKEYGMSRLTLNNLLLDAGYSAQTDPLKKWPGNPPSQTPIALNVEEIITRNQAGETIKDIAASLGVSNTVITDRFRAAGYQAPRPPQPERKPLPIDSIIARLQAGESMPALCTEFNVSRLTMLNKLHAVGYYAGQDTNRKVGQQEQKINKNMEIILANMPFITQQAGLGTHTAQIAEAINMPYRTFKKTMKQLGTPYVQIKHTQAEHIKALTKTANTQTRHLVKFSRHRKNTPAANNLRNTVTQLNALNAPIPPKTTAALDAYAAKYEVAA